MPQRQLRQTEEFFAAGCASQTNSLPVARTARPYSLASEGEQVLLTE
jgi:hypothetical protein